MELTSAFIGYTMWSCPYDLRIARDIALFTIDHFQYVLDRTGESGSICGYSLQIVRNRSRSMYGREGTCEVVGLFGLPFVVATSLTSSYKSRELIQAQ